ncbi:ester cyclase [Streptomyces sp. NPDC059637]|uniref:ester cyclase n=1 Tax=Streptomyces sp. NPDC059637 TaxID=3347752 RepID=UPI0036D1585B
MTFVQIVEGKTDRWDEMDRLMDAWAEQTRGKRTATHSMVGRDRTDTGHWVEIVEFPSYEEAVKNSRLPETNRVFEQLVALCTEPPTFTDLDVVRDEQLNKETARRFFQEVAGSGGTPSAIGELCTTDCRSHDPAEGREVVGLEDFERAVEAYREALGLVFTVEGQIAEGDEVATSWRARGVHRGEFMEMAPTGKHVEFSGTTVQRFRDGKICESRWHWDALGLLRQIGAVGI